MSWIDRRLGLTDEGNERVDCPKEERPREEAQPVSPLPPVVMTLLLILILKTNGRSMYMANWVSSEQGRISILGKANLENCSRKYAMN